MCEACHNKMHPISIHALRVEGDLRQFRADRDARGISIHALRVEGDLVALMSFDSIRYFYPRPPGGGRHLTAVAVVLHRVFLSTPSGWRATYLS